MVVAFADPLSMRDYEKRVCHVCLFSISSKTSYCLGCNFIIFAISSSLADPQLQSQFFQNCQMMSYFQVTHFSFGQFFSSPNSSTLSSYCIWLAIYHQFLPWSLEFLPGVSEICKTEYIWVYCSQSDMFDFRMPFP